MPEPNYEPLLAIFASIPATAFAAIAKQFPGPDVYVLGHEHPLTKKYQAGFLIVREVTALKN